MKISLTVLLLLSLLAPVASPLVQPEPIVQTTAKAQDVPTAVYLQYEDGFMPMTLFQNGKSLIRYYDDTDSYFNAWYNGLRSDQTDNLDAPLAQSLDDLAGETFTCYTLPSPEKTQTVSFEQIRRYIYQLPTDKMLFEQPVSKPIALAVNDSDAAFLADVAYSSYTAKEQQKIPQAYTNYVRRKLNVEGLFHTPVIIKEIWEFDFDSDGKKEAFIYASNLLSTEAEKHTSPRAITAKPAYREGIGYYNYALFYSETFLPLDFCLESHLMSRTKSFQDKTLFSLDPPFSYQYDNQDGIRLLRMWIYDTEYKSSCIEYAFFMLPIIGDFDQDGCYDFCISYPVHGGVIYEIYLQKAEQVFQGIGGFNAFVSD